MNIIVVYKCMLIATKHHFVFDYLNFKWLLLDDNSNPYIDANQFSRRVVAS